ncbi:hypothetical protein [Luteimonas panaciterrae]|uniref:hypothetical protein n=1 Tax=Luteimonas panaciterrae TaxID=363885 RepID=UPI001CFA9813|nr:hypothetical protein [Luteimonas panaciterrae]
METSAQEPCPRCGETSTLREKLLLIDEAWVPAQGKDSRLRYAADLRVGALKPAVVRQSPLEQFVDGFFCEKCQKGFVPDDAISGDRYG